MAPLFSAAAAPHEALEPELAGRLARVPDVAPVLGVLAAAVPLAPWAAEPRAEQAARAAVQAPELGVLAAAAPLAPWAAASLAQLARGVVPEPDVLAAAVRAP